MPALTTFSGNQQGTFMDGVSTFKESNDLWNKVLDAAAEAVGSKFYFAPTWLSNKQLSDPDSADLQLSGIANWFGHGEVGSRSNVTAEADASVRRPSQTASRSPLLTLVRNSGWKRRLIVGSTIGLLSARRSRCARPRRCRFAPRPS